MSNFNKETNRRMKKINIWKNCMNCDSNCCKVICKSGYKLFLTKREREIRRCF